MLSLAKQIIRIVLERIRPEILQSYIGVVTASYPDGTVDVSTSLGPYARLKQIMPWPESVTQCAVGAEVLLLWPEPYAVSERQPVVLGWLSGTATKVMAGTEDRGVAFSGAATRTTISTDNASALAVSLLSTGLFTPNPSPPPAPLPVVPCELVGAITDGSLIWRV